VTTPAPLPWLPGVVRAFLADQATFVALVPLDRLVFKAPTDVTTPYARIQVPSPGPMSGDGVAWRPLVQVDAFYPKSNPDADDTVWNIVAAAAVLLGRARNIITGSVAWSGRHLDGPIPGTDTSRGESAPMARALIRAELTLHAR
jgi:hypothetical protein